MPLRMLLDSGAIDPGDVALVGARDLDPPEREFIQASGLHTGQHAVERALSSTGGVYVAVDADGLDEAEVSSFMPVPGGIPVAEAVGLLRGIAADATVVGAGLTGLVPDPANLEPAARLCVALGL